MKIILAVSSIVFRVCRALRQCRIDLAFDTSDDSLGVVDYDEICSTASDGYGMKASYLFVVLLLAGPISQHCGAAPDLGDVDVDSMLRTLKSSIHDISNPAESDQTVFLEFSQDRDIQKKLSERAAEKLAERSGMEKRRLIMRWRTFPNGRSYHMVRTSGPDSHNPKAAVKNNLLVLDLGATQKRITFRNPDIDHLSYETITEKKIDRVSTEKADLFPDKEIGVGHITAFSDRLVDVLNMAKTYPDKNKQVTLLPSGKVGFAYESGKELFLVEFDPSSGFLPSEITSKTADGAGTSRLSFEYENISGKMAIRKFHAVRCLNGSPYIETNARVVSRRERSALNLENPDSNYKDVCIQPDELESLLNRR